MRITKYSSCKRTIIGATTFTRIDLGAYVTWAWRLVSDTVLRHSPFKTVGLTACTLFTLPFTAKIERRHVMVPVRQWRNLRTVKLFCFSCHYNCIINFSNLVGFIIGNHAKIMSSLRRTSPHVVRCHHQIAVSIVTALLSSRVFTVESLKYCIQHRTSS